MSRRHRAEHKLDEAISGSDPFSLLFVSFSLLMLAFFAFVDALSVPNTFKRAGVFDSLAASFSPAQDEKKEDNLSDTLSAIATEAGFQVRERGGEFRITIPGAALFPSASADLYPAMEATLRRLADILRAVDVGVTIEGHTDSEPIATTEFPSNWALSAARAAEVLRIFRQGGVPAERLRAAGRASFVPVVSNETESGRALNRRVEIIINGTAQRSGG
ncbi:MAG: OmpA family protein [Bdellovibrionales bacterium]|nr:OmpA family protein [Bdellovibrionales bacterium]